MIDYQTYCQIKHLHHDKGLNPRQIADETQLDTRTVTHYLEQKKYPERKKTPRTSKLDIYRGEIARMLAEHKYSAAQIFQKIREMGFEGGKTIVTDYVTRIRPPASKAYLTLHHDKGESVQIDWGMCGTIRTGQTMRKLHFFTMVLGYSRMLFVQFTVLERMEHFLECIRLGFNAFGGVPRKLVMDNLKTGVLSHPHGMPAVFHPRLVEMAEHYGFEPVACNPRSPNEKGMVEKAVSYVKGNFINGHSYETLDTLQAAAVHWLNTVANQRVHSVTGRRPCDMLAEEKPLLRPIYPTPYDTSVMQTMRASSQFRITLDTNRYSVPWKLAGQSLNVKIHMDHVSVFHEGKLVARHPRSYDRRCDFEHPDHVNALLAYRKNAHADKLRFRFLSLHPCAETFYRNLCERRPSARIHVQKIMALADLYGNDAVVEAIQTALYFHAYSSDYILHILDVKHRYAAAPGPLHLTQPNDALRIDINPPDLNRYTP